LAERGSDHQQSSRENRHFPKAVNENLPLRGKRVDKVRKVFALDNAVLFEPSYGIVADLQCLSLDATEPSLKACE
jgi:hypothetical protein